jgi:hypothetical protein
VPPFCVAGLPADDLCECSTSPGDVPYSGAVTGAPGQALDLPTREWIRLVGRSPRSTGDSLHASASLLVSFAVVKQIVLARLYHQKAMVSTQGNRILIAT